MFPPRNVTKDGEFGADRTRDRFRESLMDKGVDRLSHLWRAELERSRFDLEVSQRRVA